MATKRPIGDKWHVYCSLPRKKSMYAGTTETEHQAILLIQAIEWLIPKCRIARAKVNPRKLMDDINEAREGIGLDKVIRNRRYNH